MTEQEIIALKQRVAEISPPGYTMPPRMTFSLHEPKIIFADSAKRAVTAKTPT